MKYIAAYIYGKLDATFVTENEDGIIDGRWTARTILDIVYPDVAGVTLEEVSADN